MQIYTLLSIHKFFSFFFQKKMKANLHFLKANLHFQIDYIIQTESIKTLKNKFFNILLLNADLLLFRVYTCVYLAKIAKKKKKNSDKVSSDGQSAGAGAGAGAFFFGCKNDRRKKRKKVAPKKESANLLAFCRWAYSFGVFSAFLPFRVCLVGQRANRLILARFLAFGGV